MSAADLDRVIEALSEAALSGAPARRSDLIHSALTLLRQMRENAVEGINDMDDAPSTLAPEGISLACGCRYRRWVWCSEHPCSATLGQPPGSERESTP